MKCFSLSLSALLLLCFSLTGQNNRDYYPPTNIRNASDYLPGHVDLIWSPPEGWQPSRVDRWFEYDRGILGENAIGSCPGCPVEIAIRWDSGFFHNYNAIYLTKIRYVLRESALDHALRVYQVQNGIFDTLFNYPLQNNLVYYRFDTTEFSPITIDKSKELWVGLWVSDLGPGYPLAGGFSPAQDGYSNMIKVYNNGYWETLMDINPYFNFPWNIGAYIETPDEVVRYPIFNVYRAIDDQPFEKIHEGDVYDTIFHDDINDVVEFGIRYYVNSVYGNGTLVSSDTLQIWTVNILERDKNADIQIYPNPASDYINIRSAVKPFYSVSLINGNGTEVLRKDGEFQLTQLDISHLPRSFYILRVYSLKGIFTSKLLILK